MHIKGIEQVSDATLSSIIKEATEELERREKQKIVLADNIARAVYKALDEGFSVVVHSTDGKFTFPMDACEFVVAVSRPMI